MEKSTASSTNVEFEIVHAVRGRVRLRLKSSRARELLPRIAHHLQQQGGILRVFIKQTSSSLVVTFDPDAISVEQLTDLLQPFGSIETSTKAMQRGLGRGVQAPEPSSGVSPLGFPHEGLHQEAIAQSTGESHAITYSRLFSLVPPLVGLAIARRLQVSGWKSILTYILAAGITREIINQVTGESEKVELSPAKQVSTTQVVAEEISSLLMAIETDFEIVHQIPGRIRLRVSRISRDRNYAQELKHLLEQDNRITAIRIKTNSSSVVILYDPEALSDSNREQVAVNDSNGKKVIQAVDESESSTIPDQKKTAKESDLTCGEFEGL